MTDERGPLAPETAAERAARHGIARKRLGAGGHPTATGANDPGTAPPSAGRDAAGPPAFAGSERSRSERSRDRPPARPRPVATRAVPGGD